MRFLADMGVSMRFVRWLRDQGHDAIHLREQALSELPDVQIFQKALEKNRIVLTFDLDFGEIAALTHSRRTGVVVFRLRNTRTPHVIDRLSAVLNESSRALDKGAVISVEETRHRIRRFQSKSD